MSTITAYKLLRRRADASLGPLFIHQRLRIPVGEWLTAEAHRTKDYAFRPGWHCCRHPKAPHLSEKGRVWAKVEIEGVTEMHRPECQGWLWYLGQRMRVVEVLS
jgi:hypothetical protein